MSKTKCSKYLFYSNIYIYIIQYSMKNKKEKEKGKKGSKAA
jgi:hypothetical protein